MLWRIVYRIVMFAVTAGVCAWLSSVFKPWLAAATWSVAIGAVCAVVGFLLSRQPLGKIGWVNRAAGLVLPWGFRISNGRLLPAVALSWLIWSLLGGVVIAVAPGGLAFNTTDEKGQSHPVLWALLMASWVVDGVALFYVTGVGIANRRGSGGMRASLLKVILVLVAIIVASAVLALAGTGSPTRLITALAIAGGPPLFVGGGYGLFLIVLLTAGRNTRWN